MNVKPLSPQDIDDDLINIIPPVVVTAVNNLLKRRYRNGQRVVLTQDDIIAEIRKLRNDISREEIFYKNWMDFERLFDMAGWIVSYEKPGYNEPGEAYFTFIPRVKVSPDE